MTDYSSQPSPDDSLQGEEFTNDETSEEESDFVAIVLNRSKGFEIPVLGSILAGHNNQPIADATARIRYSRGILARGLEREKAEEIGRELDELGEEYRLVDMAKYGMEPQIFTVGKVKIEEEGLRVFLSGYREKVLEWDKIMALNFVTLNQEKESEQGRRTSLYDPREQQLTPKTQKIMAILEYYRRDSNLKPQLFFDIFYQEGPAIYRFPRTRLNFSLLERTLAHSLDNFLHFFQDVESHLPDSTFRSESTSSLVQLLREIETQALEGDDDAKDLTIVEMAKEQNAFEKTIFYKTEELKNYNEWLSHRVHLYEKAIPTDSESIEEKLARTPLSKETGLTVEDFKGPIIFGGLGAIYFPLSLYGWAVYKHQKNQPGLTTNVGQVELITTISTVLVILLFFLIRRFKKIRYLYLGSLLFISLTFYISYPLVLALSDEYGVRVKIQRDEIQQNIRLWEPGKKEEIQKGYKVPSSLEEIYEKPPTDPWGNRWYYQRKGKEDYTLKSRGPDGELGTKDDM